MSNEKLKMKLIKEFTTPKKTDGSEKTFKVGTVFELQSEGEIHSGYRGGSDGAGGRCAVFKNEDGIITIGYSRCHKFFAEFTSPPEIEQLEEWGNDGGCESILGQWVEQDGYDEYGMPSWMIVMGMI